MIIEDHAATRDCVKKKGRFCLILRFFFVPEAPLTAITKIAILNIYFPGKKM